ncbi:hypothetical protein ACN4EK_25155 [Pantanalinema rosaneae CENA516]|uniref:hypothetical protein n=1 Tax=Pantanalinema rosaneae TaxID=1620701 RepID=UPI003D6E1715
MNNRSMMILNRVWLGFALSLGLIGCNSTSSQPSQTASPANAPTPSATASPGQANSGMSSPAASTATPTPSANSRPPLTVAKLQNAEYYILAKGPIKLTNGKYEDPDSKRTFVMDEVVTYGDLNQDGIKDAVTSIKVSVPNSGDFSYLVAVINQFGNPKNISAEFLGSRVKVQSLEIKPDRTIAVAMDQYQPNDPECCPSLKINSTYKFKDLQTTAPSPPVPQ